MVAAEGGEAPVAPPVGAQAQEQAQSLARQARLWAQKWRWYERNSLPWNRARIHWELMRREAFVRWPVHGNVLEALREGRLEIGAGALLEPGVWITAPGAARVRIGAGTFLNMGVMVAAQELVEIGDHCMLANGCFVSDSSHRFEDPELPVTWQGFTSKGPTRIGDNCWLGARFVKRYANLQQEMNDGVSAYAEDVRARRYPAPEHTYSIDAGELAELRAHLAETGTA